MVRRVVRDRRRYRNRVRSRAVTTEPIFDGFFAGGRFVPVRNMKSRVEEGRLRLSAIRSHGWELKVSLTNVNAEGEFDELGDLVVQVVAVPWGELGLRVPLSRKLVKLAHETPKGETDARSSDKVHVIARRLPDGWAGCLRTSQPISDPNDAEEVLDKINIATREILAVVREL